LFLLLALGLGLLVGGLLRGFFTRELLGLGLRRPLGRDAVGLVLLLALALGLLFGGLLRGLFAGELLGLGLRRLFRRDAIGLFLLLALGFGLLFGRFLRRLFAGELVGLGLRRLLGSGALGSVFLLLLGLRDQHRVRVERQLHLQQVAVGRDVGVDLLLEADHDARDRGRGRAVGGGLDGGDGSVADLNVLRHALEHRLGDVDHQPRRARQREGREAGLLRALNLDREPLHLDARDGVQ